MNGFSVLHVQESKRLVALTLNLISVQPCAGRENEKREKVEIIYFREINVPGTIPVIQYLPHYVIFSTRCMRTGLKQLKRVILCKS